MSAISIPFFTLSPATPVDAGRLAVEDRLFGFVHEQVSARLFALERAAETRSRNARVPASVTTDLVPAQHDILGAQEHLSPQGRRMATRITNAIFTEGRLYGFDPLTVFTVVDQESHMNTMARGSVGERGLVQIRPSTARAIARKIKVRFNSDKLYDPEYNLHVGLAYLSFLRSRYKGYESAYLDAYNMGPSKMVKHSIASKSKEKRFAYSATLAQRRKILMSEYQGHAARMDANIHEIRNASNGTFN